MKDNLLISIAMATYNGEKYLKEQLDSIYAQTYKNIEVIVTDDCSTDNTVEILEKYSKSHGLRYYVNEKNLGFVKNFEKVISLCEGEYIALSDQDDIWKKNKLEILINKIGSNLLIHSDCLIIDENDNIIMPSWKREQGNLINIKNLFFMNVVTGCTVLLNKKLLNTALPFPEGIVYHDWWLALCAAKENSICYTPLCLTRYRQHSAQDTGIEDNKKVFILKRVYFNIKNRYYNIDFHRVIAYKKHIKNLMAVKNNTKYDNNYKNILNDAIIYFKDYLNNLFHIKTFLIGMKYNKDIYPHRNYLYIKNLLLDIVG